MTELSRFPEVQKWLDKTFEAHPERKNPVNFDFNKHRLDGNYLKVVMAVHRFKKIPMLDGRDKKLANQLLIDCKNILKRGFEDSEAEMMKKVDSLIQKNPNSRFTKVLKEQFEEKDYSLKTTVLHDLKAARNQNILQKLVAKIEGTVSAPHKRYYSSVNETLKMTSVILSRSPDMKNEEIINLLQGVQNNLKETRERLNIKKSSSTEVALEKLVDRASSEKTLEKRSEAIRELRQANVNVKR
jgi:hypothetical protein